MLLLLLQSLLLLKLLQLVKLLLLPLKLLRCYIAIIQKLVCAGKSDSVRYRHHADSADAAGTAKTCHARIWVESWLALRVRMRV